jgi:hypothetical protein
MKEVQPSLGKRVWRAARWPLAVLVVLYFALVLYRIPAVGEQQRTLETVKAIQSRKISMADVLGSNLPPQPYERENEATVAGIDKNGNHVRDDVELAIFAKYPNDAKVRAAELQYAMTEQMFLTEVFNTETWKAVAEQNSRAYACVGESFSPKSLQVLNTKLNEVDDLVFNSQLRKNARTNADSFTTSFALPNDNLCNVDLNSL